MTRAQQAAQLGAVVRIRRIEQSAAEAALQTARLAERGESDALDRAAEAQRQGEAAWLVQLQTPRLDLQLSRLFAAAIGEADAVVRLREHALAEAVTRRERATGELQQAQARLDAAERVARRLLRQAARRLEENRLAAAADRWACRGGAR